MDLEIPKFQKKWNSESGLKNSLNRGTQQRLCRFCPPTWKSETVENIVEVLVSNWKLEELKSIIWTSKRPSVVQKIPWEVG